jgi:hypothetical protein
MTFTKIHVVISLIGILTGLVVLIGLISGRRLNSWTAWFLVTAVATSATGFFFPFHGVTPAIVVGIISLLLLAVAIFARYFRGVAMALRGHCDDCPLSECVRFDRPTFPESAIPESSGANSN